MFEYLTLELLVCMLEPWLQLLLYEDWPMPVYHLRVIITYMYMYCATSTQSNGFAAPRPHTHRMHDHSWQATSIGHMYHEYVGEAE